MTDIPKDSPSPEPVNVDHFLEQEKTFNKTQPWNKLHNTSKIQKLHAFAEKYGKKHDLTSQQVRQLKTYFSGVVSTRLHRTKDVSYDKVNQEITDVPGLMIHPNNHDFTIRSDTGKRQSTLKSLAPKRNTERSKHSSRKIENTPVEEKTN